MKTKLFLMCVMAASAAYSGAAMPTEAEVEKAVPKVERMLASEKVALASGKMTRAEVAAAAMKLAAGADDEAAKLLLMKGAFILHVKDGDLEKAVKTMNALETAIADMPPQIVTNIIETALLGLPNKAANGARLYRLLDEAKTTAKVVVADGENMKALVDGYTWTYRVKNGEAEIVAEKDGKPCCAVSPKPTGPVAIPTTLGGAKVTSIGQQAFDGCKELTAVAMPHCVKTIGDNAFRWCALKTVEIPEGVTNIGDRVFRGCGMLAAASIPSSVMSFAAAPFAWCGQLREIDVATDSQYFTSFDGVLCTKDMSELVMCPNGLTAVTIPESVTVIRSGAFHGCKSLVSLTIPSHVENIKTWAFWGCRGLVSVTISPSVTNIEDGAFGNCRRLMSVTMKGERPVSQDVIFQGCRNLKSIHVPANAKSWAGMAEWQGIPLAFDGEVKGVPEMTPVEREFKIGVAPGTVVEVDIGGCPLQFVSCPAGKFRMGYSEKPEVAACREIEISSPFWMTKGRLTMEQLRALGVQEGVTENKEGFACVDEASLMVEKLPQLLNKRFEGRVPEGYVFRLPTEAEFEYVQKAGAVGNDPRLAWGYSDDTDSVPNPWGVQKLFYSGGKDCFLDRVGGGKDVVSRFARNTHWTDLVSINYENQPSRDPVGWCEGNRWAVLRRVRNNKLTGRRLYGSTFYFVLAPDESRLNKFIWK